MKTLDYKCKFCGTPRTAEYEDTNEVRLQLQKWQAMIACPRCYTFHTERAAIFHKIGDSCTLLDQSRYARAKELPKLEEALKNRITGHLEKLTRRAANHFGVELAADESVIAALLSKPDHFKIILGRYLNSIKAMQPAQTRMPYAE